MCKVLLEPQCGKLLYLLFTLGSLHLALTSRRGDEHLLLNLRAGGANQMPTGARQEQLELSGWASWTAGAVGEAEVEPEPMCAREPT